MRKFFLFGLTTMLLFMVACQIRVDTLENNKAVVIRLYDEILNKADVTKANEIISSEFVGYISEKIVPGKGPEMVEQFEETVHKAFPDVRIVIEDMIAERDMVAVRWRETGTHKGEYMGIAPTNKKFNVVGMSFYRVAGGKVVEARVVSNDYILYTQLGVISPLGEGNE